MWVVVTVPLSRRALPLLEETIVANGRYAVQKLNAITLTHQFLDIALLEACDKIARLESGS